MATLLKNNSTTGVYIIIEENGRIAANAPGDIDLDNLVVGTGYMYFDDFGGLLHNGTTPDTEAMFGWSFSQDGTTDGKIWGMTGGCALITYKLVVTATATQQQNFEKFFHNHTALRNYQLYLVRQWASTTFKQFSINGTLQNYIPVILVGYTISEIAQQGYDVQNLEINLVHAYRNNAGAP
jgi:hypothetical protein